MNPRLNLDRATWATFWALFCGLSVASSPGVIAYPYAVPVLAVAGCLALLYFVVGVAGVKGGEPDFMAKCWPVIFAAAAAFLMGKGYYLPREWRFLNALLQAFYIATLAAAGLRFVLVMRPMPSSVLPDPSKVAGMPMAGPASRQAAHAALRRGGASQRPKFRT